jgi:hypothetical protein
MSLTAAEFSSVKTSLPAEVAGVSLRAYSFYTFLESVVRTTRHAGPST